MGGYCRKGGPARACWRSSVELFPDLTGALKRKAGTLSGGQRTMLAMARGLMLDPAVLVLDEPSAGLSPIFQGMLWEQIAKIAGTGVSILVVEQNTRRTLKHADWAYVMVLGKNQLDGPAQQLAEDEAVVEPVRGAAVLRAGRSLSPETQADTTIRPTSDQRQSGRGGLVMGIKAKKISSAGRRGARGRRSGGCGSSSSSSGVGGGGGGGGGAAGNYGVLSCFSGRLASLGQAMIQGAQVAKKAIDAAGGVMGNKVNLTQEDTQCDLADAVPATQKLLSAGVSGVIGPETQEIAAVEPILKNSQIVDEFQGGDTSRDHQTDPFLFRDSPSDSQLGVAMALYAYQKGYRRAALMFYTDVAAQTLIEPVTTDVPEARRHDRRQRQRDTRPDVLRPRGAEGDQRQAGRDLHPDRRPDGRGPLPRLQAEQQPGDPVRRHRCDRRE